MILFPSLLLLLLGLTLKALGYDRPLAILPHFGTLSIVNDMAVLVVPGEHMEIPVIRELASKVDRVLPVMIASKGEPELMGLRRWLETEL